jgi:phosphoglucosamine mutase
LKQRNIFGTDGVRGKANSFPMTIEIAQQLGKAAGYYLRTQLDHKPRVVIGKDTRLSCYMIENALISGFCSVGVDTLMVGPLPTPGVAFITRAYRADAGVVISASHNPYCDNGIKFFSAEGYKFSDQWELEIESLIGHLPKGALPQDHEIGKNTKVHDAQGRYIEFVKSSFPKNLNLRGIKIVLDCANGGGYMVAPKVFEELDAEVHAYGVHPDGLNINEKCGALFPDHCASFVTHHGADIGIAIDGDADRVILVDEKGNIHDGDTILAICARAFKEEGKLANHLVVSTVMANYGFKNAMRNLGIAVIESQVGDRYVIQKMLEHSSILGGEQSGHIIFSEYNSTGDALVSALQVLRIMVTTGQPLSKLASFVEKHPQICINVAVREKKPFSEMEQVRKVIEQAEQELEGKGRILVRYSGTELICRVMVEGEKQQQVDAAAHKIAQVVEEVLGM